MTTGDTIVAPATPFGYSGIAVIRISGPNSFNYLSALSGKKQLNDREATLSSLKDGSGSQIDRCLFTAFFGPRSYTGEDLVEISTHGNPAVVEDVVNAFCSLGARPANAGEFTKRAFLNGKMDLLQVEAVASLIHSKSAESARCQQKILKGSLSVIIHEIRDRLISLLSRFEYQMDISEEDSVPGENRSAFKELTSILVVIDRFKNNFYLGRLLNRGASVVIVGKTNVGKSTLLNLFAGSSRAIVSDIPGTTRDTVEVELLMGGAPVLFIDTAGIRESDDIIEKMGVARAKDQINNADLILSLTDKPHSKHLSHNKTPVLKVVNKSDTNRTKTDDGVIHISAKNNSGVALLKKEISVALGINKISTEEMYLSTSRQHRAIKRCSSSIKKALALSKHNTVDLELLSFEVRASLDSIDTILGKTSSEDILNHVFSTLCVGK